MAASSKLPLALQLVLLSAAGAFTKFSLNMIHFSRSLIASWSEMRYYIAEGTLSIWGSFSRPFFRSALLVLAAFTFWRVLVAPRKQAWSAAFWFLVLLALYFFWHLFVWYNGGEGPWRLAQDSRGMIIFTASRVIWFLWVAALLAAVWPNYVLQRSPGT